MLGKTPRLDSITELSKIPKYIGHSRSRHASTNCPQKPPGTYPRGQDSKEDNNEAVQSYTQICWGKDQTQSWWGREHRIYPRDWATSSGSERGMRQSICRHSKLAAHMSRDIKQLRSTLRCMLLRRTMAGTTVSLVSMSWIRIWCTQVQKSIAVSSLACPSPREHIAYFRTAWETCHCLHENCNLPNTWQLISMLSAHFFRASRVYDGN